MKELLGFFINQVFVGVFQYDSGAPKHASPRIFISLKFVKSLNQPSLYIIK